MFRKILIISLLSLPLGARIAKAKCDLAKQAYDTAYATYQNHHRDTLAPASRAMDDCLKEKKFEQCEREVNAYNEASKQSTAYNKDVTEKGTSYDYCVKKTN